ncbi:MAG: Mini-ribonuclease 3 [Solobacterium sp.]|jgi:ribonuclease-3 family protein|nr:Mini-ribonuclease 3 [Solobacterium sp.]
MNPNDCSGRTLAFLGDAVWSLAVRADLVEHGKNKGKTLQKDSIAYVNAKAQCRYYNILHEEGFFTEQEEEWFRRGRNTNSGNLPGHTSAQVYRISTGFEAILGGLYLEEKRERIGEIWQKVRNIQEAEDGTIDVREECCKTDTEGRQPGQEDLRSGK